VKDKSPQLSKEKRGIFHTFVAKGLFLCKRAHPDIQQASSFLLTRVRAPDQQEWFKLEKMMLFLNPTQNHVLTVKAHEPYSFLWHLDAASSVHNDKKSHTGSVISFGSGAI
jgi:hypothetical protein